MTPLTDPYKTAPQTSRIQTRISTEDHTYLTHLNPKPGSSFIQPLINTIYHKLITQLRKEKIHDYTHYDKLLSVIDRLNFDDHIQSGSGTAIAIPIGQGCVTDDRGGVESTSNPMERNAGVDANTKNRPVKRNRRLRGGDLVRELKGKGEVAK